MVSGFPDSPCREIGFHVPAEKEKSLVADLKKAFEKAVRDEFAREEQARIKAQIREEERRNREIEKQRQDAEKQKRDAERVEAALQTAVEKALREGKSEHSAEVAYLRSQLIEAQKAKEEAEAKAQRAISLAQLTKSGHVYVISNVGSFGDGVFKIGMTRRETPDERVDELGGASVPFPFHVHMMIPSDNAPALESLLHREFRAHRVNRVNPRKEYFRVELEAIRRSVEANHGEVTCFPVPDDDEYRQSLTMSVEDSEFIERTVQDIIGEETVED